MIRSVTASTLAALVLLAAPARAGAEEGWTLTVFRQVYKGGGMAALPASSAEVCRAIGQAHIDVFEDDRNDRVAALCSNPETGETFAVAPDDPADGKDLPW